MLLQSQLFDPSIYSNRALLLATQYNQFGTVQTLLSDPRVSIEGGAPFNVAAAEDNLAIFQLLQKYRNLSPQEKNQAFIYASQNNCHKITEYLLLDAEVDPAIQDNISLRKAAERGYADMVERLLLDSRTNPAACNNQAIQAAVVHNQTSVVKILMGDPRVDCSANGNQAIKSAVFNVSLFLIKSSYLALGKR